MRGLKKDLENANLKSQQIYIIDEDIPTLKKLGKLLAERSSDYEILALNSIKEAMAEIRMNRPVMVITAISFSEGFDGLELIKYLREHENTRKIPIIAIETRNKLEEVSRELQRYHVEMVPKAIRIPYFLGVFDACVSESKSVEATPVRLKAGELLFREGESGDSIFVHQEGRLLVYKENQGQEIKIIEIADKQLIGEMAFLDGRPRSASVRAVTDCEVLELKLGPMDDFLKGQPFWMKMLIDTLVDRLRTATEKKAS